MNEYSLAKVQIVIIFLVRTLLLINFLVVILAVFPDSMKRTLEIEWNYPQVFRLWVVEYYHSL